MANFIGIIDPEPQRRERFIATVEPLLPIVDGLVTERCSSGNFQAAWAANKHAPVNWIADEREGAAIIWGEPRTQNSSEVINAANLKRLWQDIPDRNFLALDGFYAAIIYHPQFGLTVSSDLLGIFGVYYYIEGEVALVGSSPELFKHHPIFKAKFNPAGLVGILLINGLFDNQTLWQGVKRLNAAHLLKWQPQTQPKEIQQYQIQVDILASKYAGLSYREQLELLNELIDKALARQISGDVKHCLFLSGGLDSRMLAGYLARQGIQPVTLTLGIRSDDEMQCAIPVARTLGLEHHTAKIPLDQYSNYSDILIKWEHLANGFNWIMDWGVHAYLSKLAPRVISGRAMGPLAGSHLDWAYNSSTKSLCFESLFAKFNRLGFTPQLLTKLLRKEVFGDLVEDTLVRMREVYQNYADDEIGRIWCFYAYHRDKYPVGSMAWQACFGAWPILPILDLQLLEATAGLPMATMLHRKAQYELVCRQFPDLAKLPLDRNHHNFYIEPLVPTKTRQMLSPLFGLQRRWKRLRRKQGYDYRYYYRTFDINNSGWQAVRKKAEPYREQVQQLFNQEVLNQVLPPPHVPLHFQEDPINEASSVKSLLGFLLWSKDNF